MTRIVNAHRVAILEALLAHRFIDQARIVSKEMARLAELIYNEKYNEKTRRRMDELPKNWLPEKSSITAGIATSSYVMRFNGFMSYGMGTFADIMHFANEPTPGEFTRRFLFKDYPRWEGTVSITFDSGPIHASLLDWETLAKDLTEKVAQASTQISTMLAKFHTVEKLLEAWPEVKPFLLPATNEKKQLPVVQTDQLNKLLDLPIS